MEELKALIHRAQDGNSEAFGIIVQRFQDMAVGYAYSILSDFHLAEDAAQEAFIEAYRCLPKLRKPDAFSSWFRKIVFKHCDRIIRRKRIETCPLEEVNEVSSLEKGPPEIVEEKEMKTDVLKAIAMLPEKERMVTTLFYINGYSQKEIGEFLGVTAGEEVSFPYAYSYPEELGFFVTSEFDLFSNIGELAPWWKLGNLKKDNLDSIIDKFENNKTPGLHAIYNIPVSELAERFGRQKSKRIYSPAGLKIRWIRMWCRSNLY